MHTSDGGETVHIIDDMCPLGAPVDFVLRLAETAKAVCQRESAQVELSEQPQRRVRLHSI
jgi:adenine/guanine phosphoribosyltransferase-like PRPP-binding protein